MSGARLNPRVVCFANSRGVYVELNRLNDLCDENYQQTPVQKYIQFRSAYDADQRVRDGLLADETEAIMELRT